MRRPTGEAIKIAHTTSAITDGGSLIQISSSGVDTGGATNGTLLDVKSTGQLAGTVARFDNILTTGTGVSIIGTGILTGAGNLLTVTGNAGTDTAGIVRLNGTALTSGTGLLITGSAPGTMTNAGSFLRIADDTVNVFRVGENGHIAQAQAAAPTGTTGTCTDDTASATSTDTHGEITATCTVAQTAIVAFNIAYAAAPHCTVTPMNAVAAAATPTAIYTVATTGITITPSVVAGETAGQWAYICIE